MVRSFERTAPVVLDIRAAGETITATPEHPFWVVGRGWTRAGELLPGSELLTKGERVARVEAVADATPETRAAAHFVTTLPGGCGAVREVCELILKAQGRWEDVIQKYES